MIQHKNEISFDTVQKQYQNFETLQKRIYFWYNKNEIIYDTKQKRNYF